jgi:hypothetical protein
MAVLAVAIFVSPAAAGAATVTAYGAEPDPTGGDDFPPSVDIRDVGKHRNDLEVRVSRRAVLVVERARRPLRARGGCRRRSAHVVLCRTPDPDTSVYLDAGGGRDVVRCRNGDLYIDGGGGNDRLLAGTCASSLRGGSGNDVLVGGRYPDEIRGGGGRDRLYGGGGDDVLYGDGFWRHRGNDLIDGGSGRDTAG